MNDVVSARKPILAQPQPRPVQAVPAPEVRAIARQSGFDLSGQSSGFRDAGRIVRNRIPRDAQITVKITADTARFMREHASDSGLSLPDIIEEAISLYKAQKGL